ncbi:hypothetical protein LCGC14_1415110 [marine sediment metagenome]|uniref:Uncharacterized protein n=1 Tax=marine sediment metagenome TaxID=412755 RepID=A0A0F9KE84_9ZZZZ
MKVAEVTQKIFEIDCQSLDEKRKVDFFLDKCGEHFETIDVATDVPKLGSYRFTVVSSVRTVEKRERVSFKKLKTICKNN